MCKKPDFFLDVHCGNAKPWALALSECFITRRKTQMGEGRGTEEGWRADSLSSRNPSVLPVSFYQYSSGLSTKHAASCSPSFFPLLSVFSLQCWPNNWRVQFWPPPFAPSHQVSFESSALALQNSIVCRPAWGCLRGPRPQEPPFSQLFNSPQRSIIGMTVTRKEGEIKQNG